MKTQEQDRYHGIALSQLARSRHYCAVRRIGSYYEIELDGGRDPIRILFIKYRSTGRTRWTFNFSRDEINRIHAETERYHRVFVAFVCAAETVCLLSTSDLFKVMEDEPRNTQTITVEMPSTGKALRVSGLRAKLRRKIPHNSFPGDIFL